MCSEPFLWMEHVFVASIIFFTTCCRNLDRTKMDHLDLPISEEAIITPRSDAMALRGGPCQHSYRNLTCSFAFSNFF